MYIKIRLQRYNLFWYLTIKKTIFTQTSHSVQYSQYRNTYIGKDCHPHGAETNGGENQYGNLHSDGKYHVLVSDMNGSSGYLYGKGNLSRVIIHQYYIGSFDGCIATQSTHGNAHIGTLQYRSIVDAIAYISERLACCFRLQE